MKQNYRVKNITAVILLIIAAAVAAVFAFADLNFNKDQLLNNLISGIILRAVLGAAFTAVIILFGDGRFFIPDKKHILRNIIWCLPCFAVVTVNFPFSALLSGGAAVTRTDALWLFILECVLIGVMEETLFRGLVQPVVRSFFKDRKYERILTVAVTAAVFALAHLFNLFAGADIGATLMQVGYCFLTGAMLSAILIKTDSLWFCIALHAIFDIGGNLIPELGTGGFQDVTFWILTAIAGVICLVHILYFLLKSPESHCTDPENNI